jgi:hypothetical protein
VTLQARTPIVCLAMVLAGAPARGQEETHQIHGFGSWAYGNTDANNYLYGRPEGSYRNATFQLNVSATVSERLRIVTQMGVQDTGAGPEIDLDFAFAEWKFSDRIKLRAGVVPQPFGISTELFDVGTLRPFLALPQAVYGPVGLTSEAYWGVGFTGSAPVGSSWRLAYDLYGGGTVLEEFHAPEHFLEGELLEAGEGHGEETTNDVIGGRIVLETPIAGLRFGASAQTGDEVGAGRRSIAAAQLEYLTHKWSARSEYAHENVKDDLIVHGVYAEVAYRIDPHWQVATQYGRLTTEPFAVDITAGRSLVSHRELALGLNYWFHPAFVCKLSYHRVNGNRFAAPAPEDLAALVASGGLRTRTNLVAFGVQFSF